MHRLFGLERGVAGRGVLLLVVGTEGKIVTRCDTARNRRKAVPDAKQIVVVNAEIQFEVRRKRGSIPAKTSG